MRRLAVVGILLATSALSAETHVSVRITNGHGRTVHIASGPVDLTAEVRVAPHEPHRYLKVEYAYAPPDSIRADIISADDSPIDDMREPDEEDGADGSSVIPLNGADERIVHRRKMNSMSGGVYDVTATVYTDEDHKKICGRAVSRVTVR